jgi:hypothetical protein
VGLHRDEEREEIAPAMRRRGELVALHADPRRYESASRKRSPAQGAARRRRDRALGPRRPALRGRTPPRPLTARCPRPDGVWIVRRRFPSQHRPHEVGSGLHIEARRGRFAESTPARRAPDPGSRPEM